MDKLRKLISVLLVTSLVTSSPPLFAGGGFSGGSSSSSGSGDVVGPSSATDNAIARFDSTTGKLIQNSSTTLDDNGFISGSATVNQTTTPSLSYTQSSTLFEDGSSFTGTDATVATTYISFKFVASASQTMKDVALRVKRSGTITNEFDSMTAYLYSDDGGSPSKPSSSLQTLGTVSYTNLSTSYALLSFGGLSTSYALVSGTTYWIVIKQLVAASGASVVFDSTSGSNYGATSSDGSTWTNTNNRLRFMVYGATHYAISGISQTKAGIYSQSTTSYGGHFRSINSYGINVESDNDVGGQFHSNTSHGVKSTSENSNGLYGISNGSAGVRGDSTVSYGVLAIPTHSTTNQIINAIGLRAQTSGTAATGFGGGIEYQVENGSGSNKQVMNLDAIMTDVTAGSEDADFRVTLMAGGAAKAEKFRVTSLGSMKLQPIASAPSAPVSGEIYVDSTPTPDELCFYDGAGWQGLSSGTDANCA